MWAFSFQGQKPFYGSFKILQGKKCNACVCLIYITLCSIITLFKMCCIYNLSIILIITKKYFIGCLLSGFFFRYFLQNPISSLHNDYFVFCCHSNASESLQGLHAVSATSARVFRSHIDHIPAEGARWQSNSAKADSRGLM